MSGAVFSHAVPIISSSYDMPNGSGVARGGMSNYWDDKYTGSGSKTVDGAILSGGSGKLTDGIIATESWAWTDDAGVFHTSKNLDRYVGWTWGDPTITFHFENIVHIDTIAFYVDNPANDKFGAPQGGVAAPESFSINGATKFSGVDNKVAGSGPLAISFTNLGLDVSELILKINRDLTRDSKNNEIRFWAFMSEVTFDDGVPAPVPEPSTMILFGAGMAGLALLRKRHQK